MALTDNLLAYWKMEGNSNDSVWSNNGTDTAITYSAWNWKSWQWAWFNWSTSRIQLPNSTILNWKTKFTINTWVTFGDHNTWSLRAIIWVQTNYIGALNSQYISSNWLDHQISFWPAGTSPAINAVNLWNTTTWAWYMLTHTYDSTLLKTETFLNGTSMGSQTFSSLPAIAVTTVMDIWRSYDSTRIHTGNMDEYAIWDRVLTWAEITQLYNWLTFPFISFIPRITIS